MSIYTGSYTRASVDARRRDWWVLGIRGLAAIAFGIAAFLWPGLTLDVLIILFGVYALVDGLLSIINAFRRRGESDWGWHLIQGAMGILAGIIALAFPGLAALALVLVIASWAIVTGIAEIGLTIAMHRRLRGEWLWLLAGVVSILLGIVLVLYPLAGMLAVVWLIGAYALVFGVLLVMLAMSIRPATPSPA